MSPQDLHRRAEFLRSQGDLAGALAACDQALQLHASHLPSLQSKAIVLIQLDRPEAAAAAARIAVDLDPQNARSHNLLGAALMHLRRATDAEAALRNALLLNPDYKSALVNLSTLLLEHDELEAAEPILARAVKVGAPPATWAQLATLVEPLPDSVAAIDTRRQIIAARIADLHARGARIDVTSSFARPMFYLAYHGRNDRDLLRDAARLYVAPQPPLAPRQPRNRIRIGILSSHWREHTIARLNAGLVANLSRDSFEVILISIGEVRDELGLRIAASADRAVVLPASLPDARSAIVAQQLDALLYTDVGMETTTYTLALSRLAPIQCALWGHPVTSGMSTVDFFLSSHALETPRSDEHYTENLIRLNDLAVCYESPPRMRASRKKFSFDKAMHLYVCPQTPFKFHPDFDPVLGEILRRDPLGRLVLVDTHARQNRKLLRRFERTIPGVTARIITLPSMPRADFLTLLATADVILDPLHFGGGNTSYEAFAQAAPIVTLPSEFLRGRITAALYRAMNIDDATATSPEHYIDLAIRIAGDKALRRSLSKSIDEASPALFNNAAGIRQFERFLIELCAR